MNKAATSILRRAAELVVLVVLLAPGPASAIEYTYDSVDRLTSVLFEDGQRMNYRYDEAGNIVMIWTGHFSGVDEVLPDARFLAARNPSPNPFNARVVLGFEIRAAQEVGVRIYDLRGRLVRDLVDEHFESGKVTLVWDGRDNSDASVASGMYVARIETELKTANVRMMLVK